MNKSEFIREKSVELLAVYIAKDQQDSDTEYLVNKAISAAEWLWEKLEENGYCDTKEGYPPVVFPTTEGGSVDKDFNKAIAEIFD